MKNILVITLVSMMLNHSAFAQSNGNSSAEKVTIIAEQLGTLKNQLIQARIGRNNAAVTLLITVPVAIALGVVSKKIHNSADKGGGILTNITRGFANLVGAVTVIPAAYSGYEAYQVVVNHRDIKTFEDLVSAKQLELEAAQRVLNSLE